MYINWVGLAGYLRKALDAAMLIIRQSYIKIQMSLFLGARRMPFTKFCDGKLMRFLLMRWRQQCRMPQQRKASDTMPAAIPENKVNVPIATEWLDLCYVERDEFSNSGTDFHIGQSFQLKWKNMKNYKHFFLSFAKLFDFRGMQFKVSPTKPCISRVSKQRGNEQENKLFQR